MKTKGLTRIVPVRSRTINHNLRAQLMKTCMNKTGKQAGKPAGSSNMLRLYKPLVDELGLREGQKYELYYDEEITTVVLRPSEELSGVVVLRNSGRRPQTEEQKAAEVPGDPSGHLQVSLRPLCEQFGITVVTDTPLLPERDSEGDIVITLPATGSIEYGVEITPEAIRAAGTK